MNELYSAIYDLFAAGGDFYDDISGRFYLYKAPQRATFPYCVYGVTSMEHEQFFDDIHKMFTTRFNLYSNDNSAIEVGTMLRHLMAMFDFCSLAVTGWNFLYMARVQTTESNDIGRVPPIMHYAVDYETVLENIKT